MDQLSLKELTDLQSAYERLNTDLHYLSHYTTHLYKCNYDELDETLRKIDSIKNQLTYIEFELCNMENYEILIRKKRAY
jgi:hypothetical protein